MQKECTCVGFLAKKIEHYFPLSKHYIISKRVKKVKIGWNSKIHCFFLNPVLLNHTHTHKILWRCTHYPHVWYSRLFVKWNQNSENSKKINTYVKQKHLHTYAQCVYCTYSLNLNSRVSIHPKIFFISRVPTSVVEYQTISNESNFRNCCRLSKYIQNDWQCFSATSYGTFRRVI